MKKFEYKVLSMRNEIEAVRKSENPRQDQGDEVLMLEILNEWGAKGWRVMNPDDHLQIFLEREI